MTIFDALEDLAGNLAQMRSPPIAKPVDCVAFLESVAIVEVVRVAVAARGRDIRRHRAPIV